MDLTSSERKILDKIYFYSANVLEGRIVAGEKVRQACERFNRDLKRSKEDPDWPWEFDAKLAVRPCAFMERFLAPTKGDYSSMELLPWECFVIGNLFGWVHRQTRLRRFQEALIVVGRGNGKSTLMAGLASYMASKDGERGADIYLLANSKEQAGIVFNECKKQIQASPVLGPRFRTTRTSIVYDPANATIEHRANNSEKLDGLNPHGAIFDEIHEFTTFKLINVIRRGMKKRTQPLALYITTMGTVLDGVLTALYGLFSDALVEGVLAEDVADRMFGYIAELDAGDDVEDETTWIKANPSLGKLLTMDSLRADWRRCKLTPQERADFITKQLNISVDSSEAAYLPQELLARNRSTNPVEALLGRACYGGFDLSSREDYTAAALLFPLDDGRWQILHHSWTTRRKVELDNEKLDYAHLQMLGLLTVCEGDYVTQDRVFEWFKAQAEKYEILSIGYDPANAIWLTRALTDEGFNCQIVRQGPITLNDPMKSFRELAMDGRIVTNDDPLLRWYMHNVRLREGYQDREKENWYPVKRNRYRKIDGFMATIDAYCVAMQTEPTDGSGSLDAANVEVVKLNMPSKLSRRAAGMYP